MKTENFRCVIYFYAYIVFPRVVISPHFSSSLVLLLIFYFPNRVGTLL